MGVKHDGLTDHHSPQSVIERLTEVPLRSASSSSFPAVTVVAFEGERASSSSATAAAAESARRPFAAAAEPTEPAGGLTRALLQLRELCGDGELPAPAVLPFLLRRDKNKPSQRTRAGRVC